MTPAQIARIKFLQEKWRDRTNAEQDELDALRRQLAAAPELPDDPRTLFVNEARSPMLDGTDYLEQLRKLECDRFIAEAVDFAMRYGIPALQAAVQVAIAKR